MSYQVSAEFIRYTEVNLVAEIGGYVGLLLGWSLLNITQLLPSLAAWAAALIRLCAPDRVHTVKQ